MNLLYYQILMKLNIHLIKVLKISSYLTLALSKASSADFKQI